MRFPILSEEERKKRLAPPKGKVHVVIDTDTYNEVDDQFALAYALMSPMQLVECRGGYSDDGQPAGRSGTQL